MKRKLLLVITLILISGTLISASYLINKNKSAAANNEIKAADTKVQKEDTKQEVKAADAQKTETKPQVKEETKTPVKTSAPVVKSKTAEKPAAKVSNVKFTNAITNKTLASVYVEFSGENAYDVTMEALNKLGRYPRVKDVNKQTGYFASMFGLTEKKSGGALSGWIFYVNGVKSTIGSKSYNLKSTDKLEWKFVQDYTKY